MAYLKTFEHDIFISYSHADNGNGWVNDLQKTLTARIDQYLGSRGELKVWFDERKVGGNEVFDDSIHSACQSSALLVCVVSPSYLNSDWCRQERTIFVNRKDYRAIGANPHATRIFKVLPLPVKPEVQPEPLGRMLGYSYFEAEPQNKNWSSQFFPREPLDLDQRFFNQTDKLAKTIADALQELATLIVPSPTIVAASSSGGGAVPSHGSGVPVAQQRRDSSPSSTDPAVYIAECTDDVEDDRYLLANELRQFEIPVLPGDTPLPIDNFEQLKAAINDALSRSLLSVHIIGTPYGRHLATDVEPQTRSLPDLQYQLAVAAGKPRIVWLSETIDEASLRPEQKQFLQMIKRDEASGGGSEYLRGSLENLKTFVKSRAPRPKPADENGSGDASSLAADAPVVFISADENDIGRAEVKKILDCCARQGFEVYRSLPGNAADREKRELTYMRQGQGFVILYASADPNWLTERVRKVSQKASGRKKNPLVAAVVDAPPPPVDKLKPEELFANPSVMVLHVDREVNCEVLGPFFSQIRARRPR